MSATLLIGGTPRAGADFLELRSLLDVGSHPESVPAGEAGSILSTSVQSASPYDEVLVQTNLELIGDLWPFFRSLRQLLDGDSVLTVCFQQNMLASGGVRSVLDLCGYRILHSERRGDVRTLRTQILALNRRQLSTSVIVPCKDEAENVAPLAQRLPDLGTHTELIFVDGNSTDGTRERVKKLIASHPDRDIHLLEQNGSGGKAAAVRMGFDAAHGDVLIILDADLTVAPEDLPRFFLALAEDTGSLANGDRLVYPMEDGAMAAQNRVGNRAFARLFSWILGKRIGDTLCGTKAIFKRDWNRISSVRPLFGGHDVWGDFDLLLGAAYTRLSIVDVPVVYRARHAGKSKMRPLRHGLSMARASLAGIRALKLERRPVRGPATGTEA